MRYAFSLHASIKTETSNKTPYTLCVIRETIVYFHSGAFWLRYGLLKLDLTMITVNVVGVSLMTLYILFYLYYTREGRACVLVELAVVLGIIGAMLILVQLYGLAIIDILGFACMTFNILNFGAPLAGVVSRLRFSLWLEICIVEKNSFISSLRNDK